MQYAHAHHVAAINQAAQAAAHVAGRNVAVAASITSTWSGSRSSGFPKDGDRLRPEVRTHVPRERCATHPVVMTPPTTQFVGTLPRGTSGGMPMPSRLWATWVLSFAQCG